MKKSPLNYVGGKYKLLPQILPLMPSNINIFVDVFAGGCNVGLNIAAKKRLMNDKLTPLVDLYKKIKEVEIDQLLRFIHKKIANLGLSKSNADAFYALRDQYNKERNPLDLFLISCFSFNHQIRFNQKKELNISFGKNRSSYNKRIEKRLIEFKKEISKGLYFSNLDFMELDYDSLNELDYVYFDPPYLITTGSYNDGKRGYGGWSETDEKQLLNLISELNSVNIKFGLSNVLIHKGVENTFLRKWLKQHNYTVFYLDKDYSNSNYQSKKGNSVEVFVTNFNK